MSKPRKNNKPEMFASASFSAVVKKARDEIKSPDLVRRLRSGDRQAYALAAGVIEAHIRWFEKTPEGKRCRALGKDVVDEYVAMVFGRGGENIHQWASMTGSRGKSLEEFLEERGAAMQRGMERYRSQLQRIDGLEPLLKQVLKKYVEHGEGNRRSKPEAHAEAIRTVIIEGGTPGENRQHYYRGIKYLIKYMEACVEKSKKMSDAEFKKTYGMDLNQWSQVLKVVIAKKAYSARG